MKNLNPYLMEANLETPFDDVYVDPSKDKLSNGVKNTGDHETLDVSNVTPEQLKTEVEKLKKDIQQLKTSKKYTEVAETRQDIKLQLAVLEWDLKNYQWIGDVAEMLEDGKIKKGFLFIWNERKKIEKRIKKIQEFRAQVEYIKAQLGIPSNVVRTSIATASIPQYAFDADGNAIMINKTKPLTTNPQIAQNRKIAQEKIQNGQTPTAEELQALGAEGTIANYITKYTNATPKQAKTIALLGAGAALWYGAKWLFKDGFSGKTFLKLWALYAGITMATWENPLSFAAKFYKWWAYAIPGLISKEQLAWLTNSPMTQTLWKQALVESILTGFNDPNDLVRYMTYDNNKFSFDTGAFFEDANLDPEGFMKNTLSSGMPIDKEQFMGLMCLYHRQNKWELNTAINDLLVWELWLDGDVLKNPTILKSALDKYRTDYKKDLAIRKGKFLSSDSLKIRPWAEFLVQEEIMRKKDEVDPNTGTIKKVYMYDVDTIAWRTTLKDKLISLWYIEVLPYSQNIELKNEDEKRLSSMLDRKWVSGAEKEKFLKGFLEAKAESNDPELKIMEKDGILYIQNSGFKVPLFGDSNRLVVNFSHYLGENKEVFTFTSYKDAILFGSAINKLFNMSVGKIDKGNLPKDKDGKEIIGIQNKWPFSFDTLQGDLKLYNNRGTIWNLFASGLGPVNDILDKISMWKGNKKNQIPALATALNTLTHTDSNNTSLYVEYAGKIPNWLAPIGDDGLLIVPDTGRTETIIYDKTLYEKFKLTANDVLTDLWNGIYKIVKKTAQWTIELIGVVITGKDGSTSVVEIWSDVRNTIVEPGAKKLYEALTTGLDKIQWDFKTWLTTDWADWYNDVLKAGSHKLAADMAKFFESAAIKAGEWIEGTAKWVVDNVFKWVWYTYDQIVSLFQQNKLLAMTVAWFVGAYMFEWNVTMTILSALWWLIWSFIA